MLHETQVALIFEHNLPGILNQSTTWRKLIERRCNFFFSLLGAPVHDLPIRGEM